MIQRNILKIFKICIYISQNLTLFHSDFQNLLVVISSSQVYLRAIKSTSLISINCILIDK
jgi:hypothetical protein